MYINYHNKRVIGSDIETIENLQGMTRKERQILLTEYSLVSEYYYLSSRATKGYYNLYGTKKDNKKGAKNACN